MATLSTPESIVDTEMWLPRLHSWHFVSAALGKMGKRSLFAFSSLSYGSDSLGPSWTGSDICKFKFLISFFEFPSFCSVIKHPASPLVVPGLQPCRSREAEQSRLVSSHSLYLPSPDRKRKQRSLGRKLWFLAPHSVLGALCSGTIIVPPGIRNRGAQSTLPLRTFMAWQEVKDELNPV